MPFVGGNASLSGWVGYSCFDCHDLVTGSEPRLGAYYFGLIILDL